MTKRFMVNPILAAIAGVVSFFCVTMVSIMISIGSLEGTLVFGAIMFLFSAVAVYYMMVVEVSKTGVSRKLFGHTVWERKWSEIKEIGICGTRVFKDKKSGNVGSLYLYFSEKKLDDKERFDLILKWPPRKMCFMLFRYDRLRSVQLLWDKQIETYNAGDFSFGEGLADRRL